MSGVKEAPKTDLAIVDEAFVLAAKVVEPLTVGDGESEAVSDARLAMQGLYVLRQWARAGARTREAKSKQKRESE